MTGVTSAIAPRRFRIYLILVVLVAAGLRLLFVWMDDVEYPIRGDVNQYVLYAWNLVHRQTFSMSLPDAPQAEPDSYRGPGYPGFLALAMLTAGHSDLPQKAGPDGRTILGYKTDSWMRAALGIQVLLGAGTVWFVVLIGELWLSRRWALFAGSVVALWPHQVSFAGVLLSETLFGFMLALSLWFLCAAETSASRRSMAMAGIAWGLTYLVNPIVALFPLIAAIVLTRKSKRLALALLVPFLAAPVLWACRNAAEVRGPGALARAEENFVQGSWPQFLPAYNSRFENAISSEIVHAVSVETTRLQSSLADGLNAMRLRMAEDPVYYVHWYFLEKPFLLWDWSVRIGWGDIYFLPNDHSPFEKIPVLHFIKKAYEWLNPVILVFAMLALVFSAVRQFMGGLKPSGAFVLTSWLVISLTAMHVILQAEPRYSIPYRPEEVLLAVTGMAWLVDWCVRSCERLKAEGGLTHFISRHTAKRAAGPRLQA